MRKLSAFLLVSCGVACGGGESPDGAGGGAGGSEGNGASTGAGATSSVASVSGSSSSGIEPHCPEGLSLTPGQLVAADSADGTCLDIENPIAVDVCAPLPSPIGSFLCFRRKLDGRRIWLRPREVPFDFNTWEWCDVEFPRPPPPCFIGACDNPDPIDMPVVSTCDEEGTRGGLLCGASFRPWDEDCCPRSTCDDGDCPPGLECTRISTAPTIGCDGADGSCGCYAQGLPETFDVCVTPTR